jgi:Rieske Fe-S protein
MNPLSESMPSPAAPLPARRRFFQWLTYGVGAVAAGLAGVPVIGYLLGVRRQEPSWVPLGAVKDFPPAETRVVSFDNPLRQAWDGIVARTSLFVRYEGLDGEEDRFLVLAVNCAHLGCPVTWFPQSGLFMCPCHGGVYYASGERASGPPPRGLYRCAWRVRNGILEVKSPHLPTLQDPLTDEGGQA